MEYTPLTKGFIALMLVAALATIGGALLRDQAWHPYRALTLLAIAALTSRMKVGIPGIRSNMSVNLPFLLIAVISLNSTEAILIAGISTAIQTIPTDGSPWKAVRFVFNISMMTFASGMAGLLFHRSLPAGVSWVSSSLLLAATTATFFLGQTVPVSAIVALTDRQAMWATWARIAQLSFPYYIVSAGATSLTATVGRHLGWLATLLLLPVMYCIYRSYRLYFRKGMQQLPQPAV